MTLPLALFASSYNEDDASGTNIQNSKTLYMSRNNLAINKNSNSNGNGNSNSNGNNNNNNTKNKNNFRKTIKQKQNVPNQSKLSALLRSMDEASDSDDDNNYNNNSNNSNNSNNDDLSNYLGVSGGNSSNSGNNGNSSSNFFPPYPSLNIKNKPASSLKNTIGANGDNESDDGDNSSSSNGNPSSNTNANYLTDIPTTNGNPISNNMYNSLSSNYANQYYNQYTQSLNKGSVSDDMFDTSSMPKNELIEKLNYIIDLLEEQQDYKTNSILEDLILYAFLGIFIIFIVDSFSKSNKYVR